MGGGDDGGEVDGLAGGVALDGGAGGIGELVPTALPEVACGGVEVGLGGTDLGHALDVAVQVRLHLVVDLLATGRLHSRTQRTGSGGGQVTMGGNASGEKGNGGDLLVHLEKVLVWFGLVFVFLDQLF